MNRKGRKDNTNRLLYDPNQREQRRLGAFSMEQNTDGEETSVTEDINEEEEQESVENKTPKIIPNKNDIVNSNKGNLGAKAKSVIASGAKKLATKLVAFIVANPWVLGIIVVVFIILIIVLSAVLTEDKTEGYYDRQCNYNETIVDFSSCSGEFLSISLKDYVLKFSYAMTKDESLNNDAIRAIMIIGKTNALSYGGYNSSSKRIAVDDCSNPFDINAIPPSNYEEIYNSIENYIYVSASYNESINYLNVQNALEFNDEIIEKISELSHSGMSYTEILDELYNEDESDTSSDTINEYRPNLFVGDSRTQGMQIAGVINSSNSVYGVGYGYNWFVGDGDFTTDKTNATAGGINGINSKMTSGKKYNIFIWLGVNDYAGNNANKYFEKYLELATGEWQEQNIFIVSVGPVDDTKAQYVDNVGINKFNNEMANLINNANLTNLKFLNLNYNIDYYDDMGVHYGNSDYKKIFNMMIENVDSSLSNRYSLYDLSKYCTFYQITENDAFWWPIGSANATNGNIYGGTPTADRITSPFGMRSGVYEETKMHNGVDINSLGETCFENVIIAAKDGTVVKVNDSCPTEGYVGSDCGFGLGNYVKIEHEDGMETTYAHMTLDSIVVKEGDTVKQGQKIGIMGSSGSSTGCHLHFGIKVNGTYVDPMNYISKDNFRPVNSHTYVGAGNASENKEYVCKSLLLSGYSPSAVAGMMVNIQHEGAFRTENLENCYEEGVCCKISGKNYGYCNYKNYLAGFATDEKYTVSVDNGSYPRDSFVNDHAGYGLIQWTSSTRKANLYDFAKLRGKSIADIDMQLEFLLTEINGYSTTKKYINGNYSAYEIASAFCKDFEKPAGSTTNLNVLDTCTSRADEANAMLIYVNNGCK